MSWTVTIPNPIYVYNQNNSPTWDGAYDENATLNCGETCIAMVLKHLREVYIAPDALHDVIVGQNKSGTTTEQMLGNFLMNNCNIGATYAYPTEEQNSANTGLINIYWKYLYANKPLISLGTLTLGGTNYNHWRVIPTLTDTTVTMLDPWYGSVVTQTYQQHWSQFKGIVIGIEKSRPNGL